MSAVSKYAKRGENEAQISPTLIRELVNATGNSTIFPNDPKQHQLIAGMRTAIMDAICHQHKETIQELRDYLGGLDPYNEKTSEDQLTSKECFVSRINIAAEAAQNPILIAGEHDGNVGALMETLNNIMAQHEKEHARSTGVIRES